MEGQSQEPNSPLPPPTLEEINAYAARLDLYEFNCKRILKRLGHLRRKEIKAMVAHMKLAHETEGKILRILCPKIRHLHSRFPRRRAFGRRPSPRLTRLHEEKCSCEAQLQQVRTNISALQDEEKAAKTTLTRLRDVGPPQLELFNQWARDGVVPMAHEGLLELLRQEVTTQALEPREYEDEGGL